MRGDSTMIEKILPLLSLFGLAQCSGVEHLAAAGAATFAAAPAPIVAAHSSQYFERTFNRLVSHPVLSVPPVASIAPPPVFVEPVTRTVPVPVPVNPTQPLPVEPNVAVAIATAHAAAPVATILLPPYHFAAQPNFVFVHPIVVPDIQRNESTTQSNTVTQQMTIREPESTTPLPSPSNTDNNFAQLPTNQNPNFQQVYGPPLPLPLPSAKPQKLKTSVEVVPVPLAYIAPPPMNHHHHHHHHHHHGHRAAKYVHTFVPAKLILRPVHVHTVRVPARLVLHKVPVTRNGHRNQKNVLRSRADTSRDVEPTTFKPFRPVSKPPRI